MERTELEVQRAFHAYCLKVINNAGVSLFRQTRSRNAKELFYEDLPPNVQDSILAINNNVEEEKEYEISGNRFKESEVKEMLVEALEMLPTDKHSIIVMYFFDNKLDREIAEMFGLSRSTIQDKRAKALKLLAKHLEEIAENYDQENG